MVFYHLYLKNKRRSPVKGRGKILEKHADGSLSFGWKEHQHPVRRVTFTKKHMFDKFLSFVITAAKTKHCKGGQQF